MELDDLLLALMFLMEATHWMPHSSLPPKPLVIKKYRSAVFNVLRLDRQ
jgi:hypothetical protein